MNKNFKNRVIIKLKRKGYIVYPICDSLCPFHLISIDNSGNTSGILCKPHGHIYKKEKERLLNQRIPIYVASELGEHEIIIKKLDEKYK